LIRIVHEALTNVFKHAKARNGTVSFALDGGYAKVIIEDDGKGFVAHESANNNLHFGLKTMRERAEAVGGKLTIASAPGKGTRIIVDLPLDERLR
jgi:two-component system sensor histidine kinase DegS